MAQAVGVQVSPSTPIFFLKFILFQLLQFAVEGKDRIARKKFTLRTEVITTCFTRRFFASLVKN